MRIVQVAKGKDALTLLILDVDQVLQILHQSNAIQVVLGPSLEIDGLQLCAIHAWQG